MKEWRELFKQKVEAVSPHFGRLDCLQTLQVNLGDPCNLSFSCTGDRPYACVKAPNGGVTVCYRR